MQKLSAYLREIWLFISSRIFISNFLKMLALVVVLLLMSNWWLRCYTNHGESVQVDDFTGMQLKDAKKKGKSKDFKFEVIDSSWAAGQPGGIILNQNPKALSRVKEGRKIYLTVTTWNAEMVELPPFSDYSYDFDQYKSRLKRWDIEAKEKERVYDRRQAENTILHFFYNGKKVTEAEVKQGYKVPRGSKLEFVITERKSRNMLIPDLVCMTFDAADFLVGSSNLNIGEVTEDESVTDRNSAYVYRQEPEYDPDRTLQMGALVNVWLTQYPPEGCDFQ